MGVSRGAVEVGGGGRANGFDGPGPVAELPPGRGDERGRGSTTPEERDPSVVPFDGLPPECVCPLEPGEASPVPPVAEPPSSGSEGI
jgi:hypothetical protein